MRKIYFNRWFIQNGLAVVVVPPKRFVVALVAGVADGNAAEKDAAK